MTLDDREEVVATVRSLLVDVLGLDPARVAAFHDETELFGALPEFDSMAVATLLTEMEERLGILIEDEDVEAEDLMTFGRLVSLAERLSLPFTDETTPSEGELRIAQAQLVGWLEGLFHGIQTAIYAQQMASRAQLEQMRRALPAGAGGHAPQVPTGMPTMPTEEGEDTAHNRGGMYL